MEFSRPEHQAVLTLGVVAGVVVAFSSLVQLKNAVISIDYTTGALTVILAIIGMVLSVYLHEWAHKVVARSIGYATHVSAYISGQLVGIAIAIFSFGYIQFFTPNTCDLEAIPSARISKHRKYENFKQQAFIAFSGLMMTAVIAILLQGAWIITGAPLLRMLMMGNIWILVFSLVPFELLQLYELRLLNSIQQLPQSDGLYILHYSLYAYVFAGASALFLALILAFTISLPVWFALLFGLAVMLFVWLQFFKNM